MLEQDEIIRAVSQREDRDELTPEVIKVMGLRGHLHGELIRIQTMLTENDAELKNISEFEISHADVVARLREIRDEARRQRDFETQTEGAAAAAAAAGAQHRTPSGVQTTTTTERHDGSFPSCVAASGRGPDGEAATQTEANAARSVSVDATDGEAYDNRLRDVSTETEMHEVHRKEKLRLAERFSVLIAGGAQPLTADEVDEVLGEHSRAVQALRSKHERDRRELLRRLQQKRSDLEAANPSTANTDPEWRRVEEGVTNAKDREKDPDSENGSAAGQLEAKEKQDISFDRDLTTPGSHPSVDEIAKTLDEMRRRGELSAEAASTILRQHNARLNQSETSTSTNRTNRRKSNHQDQSSMDEAVNQLVKDTQYQKEQIQKQKLSQKELIDRKLRAKLNMTKKSEEDRPV